MRCWDGFWDYPLSAVGSSQGTFPGIVHPTSCGQQEPGENSTAVL